MAEVRTLGAVPRVTVDEHRWRRRQAMLLVAQLPESPDEAMAVLMEAQRLVRAFWLEETKPT